jgi:hypothetical protein
VPAATCTVQAAFRPASTGAKTANLLIPSDDPAIPVLSVLLNGIGKAPVVSVTRSGTGVGTVTSSPAGISCGSSCTADFLTNTAITLTAAPDTGYSFTGWSGACSGSGSCALTANADISVTATFDRTPISTCSASPVKAGNTYYLSIQAAYDAASDGSTIELLAYDFAESFTANRNVSVTLDGGYLCGFTVNPDTTVLHGAPRLSAGTVNLKNIRITQ